MASVFPGSKSHVDFGSPFGAPRLARSMSHHASGALLIFAGLQVAGVVALNGSPGGSALPFLALAVLLVVAIPWAKTVERRWSRLSDTALPSLGLMASFRRDRALLWRLAWAVPPLWLGLFAAMAQAA